ncbi:tungstate transport system substrate-binding protein [Sporomusaceae bacterium BoRhaA]|uniref:substrate-binding domain-containing protein n=1 Tax=Pelorhabdus rhamnosifermentans TaxID=2772457 RepID=UPI0028AD907D|nr:substrate-binding domain-containing protein [Pelorhabdus rhamnosifermentans]MBU2702423.1 tungstate transport system substrate-binding protein [Pelorhabdus rhamnosifermentans]
MNFKQISSGFTAFVLGIVFLSGVITAGCTNQFDTPKVPENKDIILATTTSTQDSGLLDVLIPVFEKQTGYKVKTIAVGSGQAIAMGEKGEADVLLAHAPDAEKKTLDSGFVVNRRLVMHNDFILVGPAGDPAHIKGLGASEALKAIAAKQAVFISRGDNSGTDQMEKKLWKQVDIKPQGTWYQESGTGMGQTLSIANDKNGYILTDRATFLAQKKNSSLEILVEGDVKLLNIYHVMEVNPDKFTKVNKVGAKAFSDFLMTPETQKLIAAYGRDKFGQSLFFADGGKSDRDFGL